MSHLFDQPEEVEGKTNVKKNIVVQINKWDVFLVQNDSKMSYKGHEMRIIIHEMELKTN